jgi:hypothetical protein
MYMLGSGCCMQVSVGSAYEEGEEGLAIIRKLLTCWSRAAEPYLDQFSIPVWDVVQMRPPGLSGQAQPCVASACSRKPCTSTGAKLWLAGLHVIYLKSR